MKHIEILMGDITRVKADAIVNAANPVMLGGGGVDGAIHRAAGPELLAECRKVKAVNGVRCPFGQARITPAGQLQAKYVIHAVGPVYHREDNPQALLHSAYEQACELALENHCHSIAFPAISCGAYGFPHQEAAEIALAVCAQEKFSQLTIRFYLFEPPLLRIFQQALTTLFT
ncbi:O-acetyl-ADP-ribose deacetylase [Vibrio quintilis]|uniref:O-acetyl-ADP-ribose deacetylase n=1 Tax=Vibrio quintilis TaxID=1117707 RepID=A0A1M7YYS8_9VIBR|nr:O-acetyl-ADP-ribose deacetylase [Vibrio quintilis]SHO57847.1 O-acetyl-ADP-ribose deacetylase [Vibrio quintilis]